MFRWLNFVGDGGMMITQSDDIPLGGGHRVDVTTVFDSFSKEPTFW